jgi:hypothetical protein
VEQSVQRNASLNAHNHNVRVIKYIQEHEVFTPWMGNKSIRNRMMNLHNYFNGSALLFEEKRFYYNMIFGKYMEKLLTDEEKT